MENIAKYKSEYRALFQHTDISNRMGVKLITGGILFDRTDYWCKGRIRDDYLLMYTFGGSAWVLEGAKKSELNPGDWFLIRPNIAHHYRDIESWSFGYIHFAGNLASEALDRINFFSRENLGFRQRNDTAANLLSDIIHSTSDPTAAGEIARNAKFLELLAALHGNYFEANPEMDIQSIVREYAEEHLKRVISLEELAKLAGMSQFHFCRKFREETGFPPMRFVQKLRIERAGKILGQSPNVKISAVAMEVGFADPLYFSKVFSKWTGMSPIEYRNFLLTPKG